MSNDSTAAMLATTPQQRRLDAAADKRRENYAGNAHPDLDARVASLMARGEPEPPRNPHHPELYWRTIVTSMEVALGIVWNGRRKQHDQRDENGECRYFRWQDPAYAK